MFGSGLNIVLGVWLASSPLTSSPTNAWAYGKMNAMLHIVMALADQAHCPSLEVNTKLLAETQVFYHINILQNPLDVAFITKIGARSNERVAAMTQEAACAEGRLWFGPDGTRIKGLLIER
ncbi:hypothetical protein [Rhizobium sp. FKL33]|uniref:hypothetical protein n=1 Tax=Rhizobium sp. FKL33 TaxID=2562307 RepID=UPI0010C0A7F9|nr:hypothetical protein [Rhizobium sp. FKL33]